jgi:eukaryotic-like serine/threonine-protein kinase
MKKLSFWLHLPLVLLLGSGILIGLIYFLDTYTKHGKTSVVPDVSKKTLPEAIKLIKNAGFDYEVDSTYRDSLPPLSIIKQYPAGGEKVKQGRTIQLIVNKGVAPTVEMPSLYGVRVASAIQYLERYNLKLGDTIFKPDFAAGRILNQLVNGTEVKPGTKVKYGTSVTLVIGSGLGAIIYNYPDFWGMTLKQAWDMMDKMGLSRGAVSVDPGTTDSMNALIYKQYPEPLDPFTRTPTLIRQGNTVDLFVNKIQRAREVDTTAVLIDDSTFRRAKEEAALLEKKYGTGEDDGDNTPKKPKKSNQPKPKAEPKKPENAPSTTPKTGEEYK